MEWNNKTANERRLDSIKVMSIGMKKQLKEMHAACRELEMKIEEMDVVILYRAKINNV